MNVFTQFEQMALAQPDTVAAIDAEGEVTYRYLLNRAEEIHAALASNRNAAEGPIAVVMDRGAELVAVLLGIMRAGGAYVPFDPMDPPERIARMISRCGAGLMVCDAPTKIAQYLSEIGAPIEIIEPNLVPRPASGSLYPPVATGGDSLAYLLFTSGTTGDPKAVEISHANMVHLLTSAQRLLNFTPADRYLASSTIAFDASVTEIFLPLVSGGSLLFTDRNLLLAPRKLARDVRDFGVTILQTAPSVWAMLLKQVPDFPKVRVAITHGEAVDVDFAARLLKQGETVLNLYGPTETTVWATSHSLADDNVTSLSPISAPIGRPLDHVTAYIAGDSGEILTGEAKGELWLGGPSVAAGYWKDNSLTAEKFLCVGSDRAYRTGDVVHRDKDGVLHYLGRIDDQIQLHGVRVEPREVEAIVLCNPYVARAVVTWFEDPVVGRQLLLAVVPRPGLSLTSEVLHEFLAERLPQRIMPTRYLVLTDLPTAPNGKIDRTALRKTAEYQRSTPAADIESIDLRTATEGHIASIWRHILGVQNLSRDDKFFASGGDSLSAVQMIIEIETMFGIELQQHHLVEAPTIRTFARLVDSLRVQTELTSNRGYIYPLSRTGGSTPLYFCNSDIAVAGRGVWNMDYPIFAISFWALGKGVTRAPSLELLAAAQITKIKEVQRKGPYRLGGYSFGGLLAYEMAQQLRSAGEDVEFLFLLDPTPPGKLSIPVEIPPENTLHPFRRQEWFRSVMRGPAAGGWTRWLKALIPLSAEGRRVVKYPLAALGAEIVNWRIKHPNYLRWPPIRTHPWRAYEHFSRRLIPRYSASPYAGRALVVQCSEGHGGRVAYSALLPHDTKFLHIDTNHLGLFRSPALQTWLSWLRQETVPANPAKAEEVQSRGGMSV